MFSSRPANFGPPRPAFPMSEAVQKASDVVDAVGRRVVPFPVELVFFEGAIVGRLRLKLKLRFRSPWRQKAHHEVRNARSSCPRAPRTELIPIWEPKTKIPTLSYLSKSITNTYFGAQNIQEDLLWAAQILNVLTSGTEACKQDLL